MSEIESFVPLVIVGHVDHGKSTFIGRLLHDTQQLTPDRLKDLEDAGRSLNRKIEYAHVTDQFQEEREANITIDTTETRFIRKGRLYMLIDAPGHKEYLANMITGAARAEHALLMLDVNEGIRTQTEKHADILKLLGVRHIAVLLNKMDLVGYKESVYEDFKKLMSQSLSARGLEAAAMIPMAAYHGENVAERSAHMSWYKGPTALDFIDSLSALGARQKNAGRMPVQLLHTIDGTPLVLGRVEEGQLAPGQKLNVFPNGGTVQIKRIRRHDQPDLVAAEAGVCVGLELSGTAGVGRGTVLAADESPVSAPRQFSADVFWGSTAPLRAGDSCVVECRTQSARATVAGLSDPESGSETPHLDQGALARAVFQLHDPIFLRPINDSDVFGRVVFNQKGEAAGCGVVSDIS